VTFKKAPKKRCRTEGDCREEEFCLHVHHAQTGYCVLKIEETPDSESLVPDEDVELTNDNPVAMP
jgi:hypothetical protein